MQPYNKEIDSIEDLEKITLEFMNQINSEESLATNIKPFDLLKKEKGSLNKLPNEDLLDNYYTKPITRIVTKESMVTYENSKYSLETKYIGKIVNLEVKNNNLKIFFKGQLIAQHRITKRKFNYKFEHVVQILQSDSMKGSSAEEIEVYAKKAMANYDNLK